MKLGPFPTNAPWGSSAIQAWLDRLRQIYNASLEGHIGSGGTDQHPVFTTTDAGFVPAPGSAAGEFLRDDGTWQPEYTVVAGSGIYVSYNHIAKTITISTSPILTVSLDFSSADNSQYLALISVGGM